jgi:general secretion pathway protein I
LKGVFNKGTSGFTLLEVMIALAIVSGVVVTVITSLNFHLSAVERNRDKVVATFLARQIYEETRLLGPPKGKKGKFEEGFENFSWEYVREDYLYPGIKRVLVTVLWNDGDSVEIETYEEEGL